ncbi:hypothetical protein G7069_03775 [Lysobacter sp. HDW10]|uniref:hypothetical protein n=1 Tax=Lysobacter sp. HDW10 TaxID=2714936 RepID=UPI00140E1A7D|nr:hypothetical protein [Lysobacter sp. HDW10]QIK80795.1 hypothetical protein G7069_03775 [Lysobacter sp. HDW10]
MNTQVWSRPAIGTALLLSVPLAMTWFDRAKAPGEGWHWGPMDFVIMGALLFVAGLAFETFSRKVKTRPQKWAVGLGILAVVVLIWIELAVNALSQFFAYLFA